ncbi:hypothetical protein GGR57DRAFT_496032 [Xylariaceae sp. FL1272]|nr:hypothetical protein GGR57DRAFT_496032 [Xylariaceae sp. FL1272]
MPSSDLHSIKAHLPPSYDASQPQPSSSHHPFQGLYSDPRTSSTQSLTPSLPPYAEFERRKLLVIYIHGFMGNDTSFQSFPAHVHKYLKLALSDSHVIHSKIYPRYKTYKSIEIARDNFSKWLGPHESPNTDVVLIGHSMGGLLAADVVLMQSTDQGHLAYFKHRILGQVALDAPLLGMHPGIVVSGISSLFRKNEPPKRAGEPSTLAPQSPDTTGLPSPSLSTYSVPSTPIETSSLPQVPAPFARPAPTFDANFDSPFPNDIRIQERSWWKNVIHFVQKHNSEGLVDAATKHVMSHMEFGSSLFDINYLKNRYEAVRKLEDMDDLRNHGFVHVPPQVRFLQYYTICNGYPKTPKEPDLEQTSRSISDADVLSPCSSMYPSLGAHTPAQPVSEEETVQDAVSVSSSHSGRSSLELLSPEPIPDQDQSITADHAHSERIDDTSLDDGLTTVQREEPLTGSPPTMEVMAENKPEVSESVAVPAPLELDFDLPAVPNLPSKPEPPNLELYSDKDARKQAEKEGNRAQKAYDQAVKDRQKAIKEREKIVGKRQKKRAQEAEKKAKEEQKKAKEEEKKKKKDEAAAAAAAAAARADRTLASLPDSNIETPALEKDTPEKGKLSISTNAISELSHVGSQHKSPGSVLSLEKGAKESGGATGKKKEGKKKERKFCNLAKVNGQVDSKWVQVFMKDMDEVAAHTGLFFAGEHYDKLVGDVGNTITEWVQSDMTKRAIITGVD